MRRTQAAKFVWQSPSESMRNLTWLLDPGLILLDQKLKNVLRNANKIQFRERK